MARSRNYGVAARTTTGSDSCGPSIRQKWETYSGSWFLRAAGFAIKRCGTLSKFDNYPPGSNYSGLISPSSRRDCVDRKAFCCARVNPQTSVIPLRHGHYLDKIIDESLNGVPAKLLTTSERHFNTCARCYVKVIIRVFMLYSSSTCGLSFRKALLAYLAPYIHNMINYFH
ncbi:hypothetical protein Trydic_g13535 [Trypoxylus dichotomus]